MKMIHESDLANCPLMRDVSQIANPQIANRLLAGTHSKIPVAENLRSNISEERQTLQEIENCSCALARQFQRHIHDNNLTRLPHTERSSNGVCGQTQSYQTCTILTLKVDGFHGLNNELERDADDLLLVRLAHRLQQCVEAGDILARVGDDQFAILLESSGDRAKVDRVTHRIQTMFSLPFKLRDRSVFVSVSLSITNTSFGNDHLEELLRNANRAKHSAKKNGCARATVAETVVQDRLLKRWHLENDLCSAIEELFSDCSPQFQLFYQPIVSLANDRLVGFEALVRWFHPQRGWISPVEFIPIAEATGEIVTLGRWVLETASDRLARWQTKFDRPDLTMSVNVSICQIQETEFAEQVEQVLKATSIVPDRLKLEITESFPLNRYYNLFAQLKQLRRLGVCLSLDDFGTGYSSLSYLHRLPVDTLKIDRSFVCNLETPDSPQEKVVQAIVGLALGLNLEIVAEGVETPQQYDRLKAMGCQFGQGYLFSQPLPAERVVELFSQS